MLVKSIAACTHEPIYLQAFPRYSEILVENWTFFIPALHLTLPYGVAPGTIAVNVTLIKRGFNACQTHGSMYPSIFNRFPVILPVSSKVRHFSTFLHVLASPGYAPGTIAVNVTRLEREFNTCQTPRSMYPSIFNRFWDIASYWSKIATISHPTSV